MLQESGYGGDGKIFPIKTWVENNELINDMGDNSDE